LNTNAPVPWRRQYFGALIVVILLSVYVYIFFHFGLNATCQSDDAKCDFTPTMAQAFATIAGLVSAMVIAELAVTQPGQLPMLGSTGDRDDLGILPRKILSAISTVCIIAWIVVGLWAFLAGLERNTSLPKELITYGQAWLGLAVASAYAYLGLAASP
jgi:hypothetical protein